MTTTLEHLLLGYLPFWVSSSTWPTACAMFGLPRARAIQLNPVNSVQGACQRFEISYRTSTGRPHSAMTASVPGPSSRDDFTIEFVLQVNNSSTNPSTGVLNPVDARRRATVAALDPLTALPRLVAQAPGFTHRALPLTRLGEILRAVPVHDVEYSDASQ